MMKRGLVITFATGALGLSYGHYPFGLETRPAGHRPLRAAPAPPVPTAETLNRV
jgi:hypothetical protein